MWKIDKLNDSTLHRLYCRGNNERAKSEKGSGKLMEEKISLLQQQLIDEIKYSKKLNERIKELEQKLDDIYGEVKENNSKLSINSETIDDMIKQIKDQTTDREILQSFIQKVRGSHDAIEPTIIGHEAVRIFNQGYSKALEDIRSEKRIKKTNEIYNKGYDIARKEITEKLSIIGDKYEKIVELGESIPSEILDDIWELKEKLESSENNKDKCPKCNSVLLMDILFKGEKVCPKCVLYSYEDGLKRGNLEACEKIAERLAKIIKVKFDGESYYRQIRENSIELIKEFSEKKWKELSKRKCKHLDEKNGCSHDDVDSLVCIERSGRECPEKELEEDKNEC